LEIDEAYAQLKALLIKKGCRLAAEEPPRSISVEQGSLWGISPKTAKKVVNCSLSAVPSETRIGACSSLASDWKNLAVIGSFLSVVVISLCWWIASDLAAFIATQKPSYWSWIATTASGFTNFQVAETFAALTRTLAVFLAVILALEIVVFVYASRRVDDFADETLNSL
jgi:hypothetical protein